MEVSQVSGVGWACGGCAVAATGGASTGVGSPGVGGAVSPTRAIASAKDVGLSADTGDEAGLTLGLALAVVLAGASATVETPLVDSSKAHPLRLSRTPRRDKPHAVRDGQLESGLHW